MLWNLKRNLRPTNLMLIVGFSVSLTAVLVGVSSVNAILCVLAEASEDMPIYVTMQNTGLSLAAAIYAFSIVNCLIAANCWMISKRRDVAIRKAFGWSNRKLSLLITEKMAAMLAVGFAVSTVFLAVLGASGNEFLQIDFSPFFVLGTSVMLLFTLFLSVLVPMRQILKIHPAEVIS